MSRISFAAILFTTLALTSSATAGAQGPMSPRASALRSLTGHSCTLASAVCNETVGGYLGPGDCLTNGTYGDLWGFPGTSGQRVTLQVDSTDFDPVVGLYDPSGTLVAMDDDSGGGLNAFLAYTLYSTGAWEFGVISAFPYETGNYTVQINCTGSTPPPPPPTSGPCVPDDHSLCIDESPGDSRYKITVDYSSNAGSGQGHAVPLTGIGFTRGGMFWFFDSTNPEMLVKVLHGCGVNNYHWVFFAATTNVGLTVNVTDTQAGVTRTYTNANGHPADPVTDTTAFNCP